MGEEEEKERFKLRKEGILSEKDMALLSGNYKIEKTGNRIISDFKPDRGKSSKAKVESTFSEKKGRFTIKDVTGKQFHEMRRDLEKIRD